MRLPIGSCEISYDSNQPITSDEFSFDRHPMIQSIFLEIDNKLKKGELLTLDEEQFHQLYSTHKGE